jgi:hypothetical protein
MHNFLQRYSTLIGWLSGLGIPMAVIFASWLITQSMETAKLESEYVKMALGILSKEPVIDGKTHETKNPSEDEMALRRWAVRLLNRKSPEKFSKEEQQAILNSTKSPFAIGNTFYFESDGRLRRKEGPDGDVVTFRFDESGRVLWMTEGPPASPTPAPK